MGTPQPPYTTLDIPNVANRELSQTSLTEWQTV